MTYLLKLLFFIGDLFFLNLAIIFSFYLQSDTFWDSKNLNQLYLVLYSNISWLYLVLVSNPYSLNKGWSLSKIFKSQTVFIFIHLLTIASLTSFFEKNYSYVQIVLMYLFFFPIYFSWKILAIYLRKFFLPEANIRNYIIIGRNELSADVRKHYLLNRDLGYRFKGYFEDYSIPSLLDNLKNFCQKIEIHEIFYCSEIDEKTRFNKLVSFGLDSLIKVKIITLNSGVDQSLRLDKFDKAPGVDLSILPLDEFANKLIKRLFDIVFSLLFLLTIFSWLFPIVALLIKFNSKGPVFYIQNRNGKQNKPFGCLKFRTMFVNNDLDFKQATKGDKRVTKIGKFLRKSSVDELPQFLNVLFGDMSLIGPRPHPIGLNIKFVPLISSLMSRHYVKPGITGLAQCMGYRGETQTLTDMENRVRLDRYYIENWTFWLDIKIIFLTIISLIRGSDKAY